MEERRVVVEIRVPRRASHRRVREMASALTDYGFEWDPNYIVPAESPAREGGGKRYRFVLLRGSIEAGREPELRAQPDVVQVWSDAPVAPLSSSQDPDKPHPVNSPFTF